MNSKLEKIKSKNKCVYILKYYLIHAYDCELVFLLSTLGVLKMKYPSYIDFIEKDIQNIFTIGDRYQDINIKIQQLVNSINSHSYYDLYNDIIFTLEC
jgi:hypothetical protein